jgi:uncharacterized membrane protein
MSSWLTPWFELALAALALGAALSLRPWRVVGRDGPPGLWLAWALLMAVFWSADRLAAIPMAQPLSGACLLMLMMGWPLAMLALLPVTGLAALGTDLGAIELLHRLVWLGIVPATLALLMGAALRRWMAHHLFVYIFGRGFFITALAGTLAGALSAWLHGVPDSLLTEDLLLGRGLAAWGDAWLCGMIVAILVAFRPQWLATYADRIYLPK